MPYNALPSLLLRTFDKEAPTARHNVQDDEEDATADFPVLIREEEDEVTFTALNTFTRPIHMEDPIGSTNTIENVAQFLYDEIEPNHNAKDNVEFLIFDGPDYSLMEMFYLLYHLFFRSLMILKKNIENDFDRPLIYDEEQPIIVFVLSIYDIDPEAKLC